MWKYIAIVITLSLAGCNHRAATEEWKAEVPFSETFKVELLGEHLRIARTKELGLPMTSSWTDIISANTQR
jgi:hypothetical protein